MIAATRRSHLLPAALPTLVTMVSATACKRPTPPMLPSTVAPSSVDRIREALDRTRADPEGTVTLQHATTLEYLQFASADGGGFNLNLPLSELGPTSRSSTLAFFRSRGLDAPSDADSPASESTLIRVRLDNAASALLAQEYFTEVHQYPRDCPLKITVFR